MGEELSCTMQDDERLEKDFLDTVAEVSTNTSWLGDNMINEGGSGEFGSFSTSQKFRDFKIENEDAGV